MYHLSRWFRILVFGAACILWSLMIASTSQSMPKTKSPEGASVGEAKDALPASSELSESIATAWEPPSMLRTWNDRRNDDLWTQRMNVWVDQVASQRPQHLPVSVWRTLILIYPNTDTDYKTLAGEQRHFAGSLRADQLRNVANILSQFGPEVTRLSGGYCKMTSEVRIIERAVTFSGERTGNSDLKQRYGFQHPEYGVDCLPEKKEYNDRQPFDNVIIVYNAGPVPQDLKGVGGNSANQTVQHVQYGSDSEWNLARPSFALGICVHEWIHGLDNFFMGLGYKSKALHHVYEFPKADYNKNWHALILQGRMLGPTEERYGYSRSAWLCGTPGKPRKGLLPVQLLSPLPGISVPLSTSLIFKWNHASVGSHAIGYRFRLYQREDLTRPIISADVAESEIEVGTGLPKRGQYLWTVQTKDADGQLSIIGESFLLEAKPAELIQKIQFTPDETPSRPVPIATPYGMAAISVSSPCGIRTVFIETIYPDGSVQIQPLRKKSANENEPIWVGPFSLRSDPQRKMPLTLKRFATAVDMGGRTKSISIPDLVLAPPNAPSASLISEPFNGRPMDPLKLDEGHDFPTQKAVPFRSASAFGDPYAFYILLDGIWPPGGGIGITNSWADFVGPDGKTERVGVERLGGVIYGQYLFHPNAGPDRHYHVTFAMVKNNKFLQTQPFEIVQRGSNR